MTNTNCLDGIACPKCGHDHVFRIEAIVTVYVTDAGVEEHEEFFWDEECHTECPSCNAAGPLRLFTTRPAV